MQQVLAVYLKWATDESVVIKKEIATLDAFVSIATDEQTEIEAQEEHAQQLIETYSKHLKEVNICDSKIEPPKYCLFLIILAFTEKQFGQM